MGNVLNVDGQEHILYTSEEYRQAVLLFACTRELSLHSEMLLEENSILIKRVDNLTSQNNELIRQKNTYSRQVEFYKMMREEYRKDFNSRIKEQKKDRAKVGIIAAISGGAVGVIAGIVIMVVATK